LLDDTRRRPRRRGYGRSVEAIVFCGIQASGKTTFYAERFLDTHVRISQDLLRTRHRLERMLALCLETRQPFVVDRVNATPEDRRAFVAPARAAGFRVVAYWFDARPADAIRRNDRRTGPARVPVKAILGTARRLVPPTPAEGFEAIFRVTPGAAGGFVVDGPGPCRPADAGSTD
jgi:predicted kinase